MNTNKSLSYWHYWTPNYWPMWLGLGCLYGCAFLPQRLKIALGNGLGWLGYHLMAKRRQIARINIQLCFKQLSDKQQRQLVKRSFQANAIGFFEACNAWFRPASAFHDRCTVHGLDHLKAALAKGKGVIALGGHFTTLDLAGAVATLYTPADAMQRPHNNQLFNAVMTRRRQRFFGQLFSRHDLRNMIRSLKNNRLIWYATDQDYGARGAVFAPFFGVPCATITMTARIAQKTGAVVLPFRHYRRRDNQHYDIYFDPPLANYPSGDYLADVTAENQALEEAIGQYPEQYLWMHRRFKTEPDGDNHKKYRKS